METITFGNLKVFWGDIYAVVWAMLSEHQKKDRRKLAYIKHLSMTCFNLGLDKPGNLGTNKSIVMDNCNITDFSGDFIDEHDSKNYHDHPCIHYQPSVFMACLTGKKYYHRTDFIFTLERDGSINIIEESFNISDDKPTHAKKEVAKHLAPFIRRESNRLYNAGEI